MPLTLPTVECARTVRDGGIDAMAGLNEALREAIDGLTAEQADEIKLAFGHVMGALVEDIIDPAVAAFPELAARGQRKEDLSQGEQRDQKSHRRLAMAQAQRLQRRGHACAGHAGIEEQLGQHQPGQFAARTGVRKELQDSLSLRR